MAGLSITVNLSVEECLNVVGNSARKLNYTVIFLGERELAIRKGSLLGTLLVGAVAPQCDFRVSVEERPSCRDILIRINRPWWSGLVGMQRVRARAKELADTITAAIRDRGGSILENGS